MQIVPLKASGTHLLPNEIKKGQSNQRKVFNEELIEGYNYAESKYFRQKIRVDKSEYRRFFLKR
jgi:hypothetical protein